MPFTGPIPDFNPQAFALIMVVPQTQLNPGFPMAKYSVNHRRMGTLRNNGPIIKSPSKMVDFLSKLDNTILTTILTILAVSAVAWQLLLTINAFHSPDEELKGENELLKARVRQLENKITFLTGRIFPSAISTSPLKMRTISLNEEKDPDLQDS